jgi:hypothetical protein
VGSLRVAGLVAFTVRDKLWNTIPGAIVARRVSRTERGFETTVEMLHHHDDIRVRWWGTIKGRPDGSIRFEAKGVAEGTFPYMRIGLVVTHPIESHRARPYRIAGGAGPRSGVLPRAIAPVVLEGVCDVALLKAFTTLELELEGANVNFQFSGDEFELEDQRNWGDASFKTFCTPLSRPTPFQATPGWTVEQAVEIQLRAKTSRRIAAHRRVILGPPSGGFMPAIGLGASAHGVTMDPVAARRLEALRLRHLRVDLNPTGTGWRADLGTAAVEADTISVPLEIGLRLDENANGATLLADALTELPPESVLRVIVLPRTDRPSGLVAADDRLVALVRRALDACHVPTQVFAGTDAAFKELNRLPPAPSADGLAFPLSPTFHTWDDEFVMDNLRVVPEIVAQAVRIAGDKSVNVGPVTLATRYGPYPCGPAGADGLPPGVDARQASLLAAAWTVGCVAGIATGGASTVTMFQTTGWHGIHERDGGLPLPDRFWSLPGQPFPVYHVIADLAELTDLPLYALESPPNVGCVAAGEIVLVANLTARRRRIRLDGVDGRAAMVRILDRAHAVAAATDPMSFRDRHDQQAVVRGRLELDLDAYAVAHLRLLAPRSRPRLS